MYKCVSILYILACLSDWCVWEGGRYLAPLWASSTFFTVQVFNNFLHISTGPRRRAHPPTLLCTYFISLAPASDLFHRVSFPTLSRCCLCFSYFSSSSSSSSTSHLQQPQHFTIPLWLCRRRGLCSHFLHFSHVSPDGLRDYVGDGSKFYVIYTYIYIYIYIVVCMRQENSTPDSVRARNERKVTFLGLELC